MKKLKKRTTLKRRVLRLFRLRLFVAKGAFGLRYKLPGA